MYDQLMALVALMPRYPNMEYEISLCDKSVEEISALLHLKPSTFSKCVRGEKPGFKLDHIEVLCDIFNVKIGYLLASPKALPPTDAVYRAAAIFALMLKDNLFDHPENKLFLEICKFSKSERRDAQILIRTIMNFAQMKLIPDVMPEKESAAV